MKKKKDLAQEAFDFIEEGVPVEPLRPIVFFDLETTGLDLQIDRIVQFAFIRIWGEEKEEWSELVNPGIPIPPEATRVHRISDETVRDKPVFASFAGRVLEFLQGCDLAGFNIARFDLPLLTAEMERCEIKLDLSQHRIIDAQIIFHKREPRDLNAAYRFYCQRELVGAHDALADVRATVEVLSGQLTRYPDLPRDAAGLTEYCNSSDDDRWVTTDRRFYWRHHQAIFAFGKHKGKSLKWVHEKDADYLGWVRTIDLSDETRQVIDAAMKGRYPVRAADSEE